jgi:hypothetical protein
METESTPYRERFSVGSSVRIKPADELENFKRNWKLHHPLSVEQIAYGGKTDSVLRVSFYHGGDVLHELNNAPGTWHEQLLEADG